MFFLFIPPLGEGGKVHGQSESVLLHAIQRVRYQGVVMPMDVKWNRIKCSVKGGPTSSISRVALT